jgi:ABC-2 type transport system permease protein
MNQTITLLKREFAGYFRSPVAYVFLVVFLMASIGLTFFVGNFFDGQVASLQSFFLFHPWMFLFLIPAVGMRLWSEEKRSGTIELLFTLPITTTQAVIGKYLAAWLFVSLAIALTFPIAITVGYLGNPDWGVILSSYIGSILMAGSFLGICSLTSALTQNQIISFILSVLVCLVIIFLGWSIFADLLSAVFPFWIVDALSNFSFTTHFDTFTKGIINVRSVVYFLSLSGTALMLNILALER